MRALSPRRPHQRSHHGLGDGEQGPVLQQLQEGLVLVHQVPRDEPPALLSRGGAVPLLALPLFQAVQGVPQPLQGLAFEESFPNQVA